MGAQIHLDKLRTLIASPTFNRAYPDPDLKLLAVDQQNADRVGLIREKISCIDKDLAKTDEILTLAREIQETYTSLRALQDQCRRDYMVMVSPLFDIPTEILGQIFSYACADNPTSRWTVAHVCQWWRRAAFATSELWTGVDVEFTTGTFKASVKEILEYAQTCVKHARSRPMTWTFRQFLHSSADFEAFEAVTKLINSAPCQELTWLSPFLRDVSSCVEIVAVPLLRASSVDTLQSLSFSDYNPCDDQIGWDLPPPEKRIKGDLRPFKKLSKLCLSISYPVDPSDLLIPRSQLTYLLISVPRADSADIFLILRECPKLQSFKLMIDMIDDAMESQVDDPIILSDLTELHFCSATLELFCVLGRKVRLETPVVQDLMLDTKSILSEFDTSNMHDYLLRCQMSLCRLWITGVRHSEVTDFLSPHFPLLEELTIQLHLEHDMQPLESLVFDTDITDEERQRPFPNLVALRILGSADIILKEGFMEIVESRGWNDDCVVEHGRDVKNGVAQLRHTYLHYPGAEKKSAQCFHSFREVERLREQGLDLVVLVPKGEEIFPSFLCES